MNELGLDMGTANFQQEFEIKYQRISDTNKWTLTLQSSRFNEPVKCIEKATLSKNQNGTNTNQEMELQVNLSFETEVTAAEGDTLTAVIEIKSGFGEIPPMKEAITLSGSNGIKKMCFTLPLTF